MSNESNPLIALSDAMVAAVEKAGAATVMVNARRRMPASGIAYTANLILTADHVVERDEDIRVLLPDGNQVPATLAGRDPGSDLALLRLEASLAAQAEPVPQPARVGQLVLALGRPSTQGIQASLGVVSAIGGPLRTGQGGLLEQYLRTDAIPYPGFSGGPLVDAAGRRGWHQHLRAGTRCIPGYPGGACLEPGGMLARQGHIQRGFLGVRSQPVALPAAQQNALGRQQASGLLLVGVETGSPAETGGLLIGDIIVAIAGNQVTDPDELAASLAGPVVGKATPVEVLRGGQPAIITVTIGERK